MKNSYSKEIRVAWLVMLAIGLSLAAWPVIGYGQRSARRGASMRAGSADPNAAGPQDAWASYDIILRRNIFSRLRVSAQRREAAEESRAVVVPNPESYYLLKGIVQEGSEFIAFVEDTQSGAVLRLRRGDRVARGAVKALTLDTLEYELENRSIAIPIGSDLEGGRGAITTGQLLDWSQTGAATTPPVPGSPPAAPSGDEAEILRRLMEQRKQQLGQ